MFPKLGVLFKGHRGYKYGFYREIKVLGLGLSLKVEDHMENQMHMKWKQFELGFRI